jgi:hypothetical protein
VGDDPVRRLAVEARFDGDAFFEEGTEIGRRWTTDELGLGIDVMEALASRWFTPPGHSVPHAWPGLITVDTQSTDGQYGLTVDDDGIHVEFWIEPKDATRARADSCVR